MIQKKINDIKQISKMKGGWELCSFSELPTVLIECPKQCTVEVKMIRLLNHYNEYREVLCYDNLK